MADEIGRAYSLSKYGHRSQLRKDGTRYFNHPRAVTLYLIDECGFLDKKLICIALLHDLREDAHLLDSAMIRMVFGRKVMLAINALTKDDTFEKSMYFRRLVHSRDWRAMVAKVADRIHNLRTLESMAPHKIVEQIKETRDEFPAVFTALLQCIPEKYKPKVAAMEHLLWELCDVQEHLHAIKYG